MKVVLSRTLRVIDLTPKSSFRRRFTHRFTSLSVYFAICPILEGAGAASKASGPYRFSADLVAHPAPDSWSLTETAPWLLTLSLEVVAGCCARANSEEAAIPDSNPANPQIAQKQEVL